MSHPTPLSLLKKYQIRPVKQLGQSFLIDINVMTKIVASADIRPDDVVVEIGAGLGVMTRLIADKAKRVIALDIDPKMVHILRNELADLSHVEIEHTDVLKYDFSRAFKLDCGERENSSKLKVIGNIPYNISSQIFFQLIDFRHGIDSMVLMFQKEVAQRIIAFPGTKEYGILSVFASMYAVPEKVLNVPSTCFAPRPKVESAVLAMKVRSAPLYAVPDHDLFRAVVKCAFARRRKMLLNNLKDLPALRDRDIDVAEVLEDIGIDGKRRGETLFVAEFGRITQAVYTRCSLSGTV